MNRPAPVPFVRNANVTRVSFVTARPSLRLIRLPHGPLDLVTTALLSVATGLAGTCIALALHAL